MTDTYDLIIIGGGAGAFAAAIRANELKAKTAVINAGLPLGGTCVNVGCVPSKRLLWAGEVIHQAKNHNIPGIDIEVKNFDFSTVVKDELRLVEELRIEKYEKVLSSLPFVTYIEGKARFVSEKEIEVNDKKFTAPKFIIATGSTANVPPIENIKEVGYMTHIEALELKEQPKELVVVGGGPVGIEFAQMFARFGTKVTVIQQSRSILSFSEKELTDHLTKILTKEGITIKTNTIVSKARKEDNKKVLSYTTNGKEEEIMADEILLAVGKTPNTKELELDALEIKVDKRQAIVVNEFFQTTKEHVFSVGDVTNLPLRLEITAGHEGTLAAANILSGTRKIIDYNTVPYTVFTDPQLAGVGLTEERQLEKMGVCACRMVSFADVPKAQIINRTEGLIKKAIHPETREILGIHILAPQAGELIAQAMMLIKNKNTIDDIIDSLPMFPTLSEAIKLVALSFTKDISKLSCCI